MFKLMSIVGIDLGGVETRPSGYCTLLGVKAETSLVYKEILTKIRQDSPKVVTVDAPLSLPPGRKSLEERNGNHLRECDRELLKRHIKFFPITLGPMRKLTERGMRLKKIIEQENFIVLETYPGGAQDVLGIPRKQRGLEKLKAGLENLGVKGLSSGMSDHELDAVTCAYVGKLFLEEETIFYGGQCGIIMPKGERRK
jgi:hypothetical protein